MQARTTSIAEIAEDLNTILITPKKDYDGFLEPGAADNIQAWWTLVDKLKTDFFDVYERFLAYNYRIQENKKKLPAEQKEIKVDKPLEAWVNTKHDLY